MISRYPFRRQEFWGADPFVCFLKGQLHLSYISSGAIALLYTLCVYGYLIIISNELNFYNFFALLFRCVLFTLLPVMYLWAGEAIFMLLRDLVKVNALELSEKDWILTKKYYRKVKPWHLAVSSLSAMLHTVLFGVFILSPTSPRWGDMSIVLKLLAIGVNLIFSYMLFSLLITLLLNIKLMRRLFSYKTLRVKLLHPDGCGGLRPLSRYALYSAYAIAVVGGMVGLSEYMLTIKSIQKTASPANFPAISGIFPDQFQMIWLAHFMVVVYILLSLLIFFGPLLVVHQEMLEAKENLLKDISQQFQADYENLKNLLQADSSALSEQVEKFNQLDAIYARTAKFPVWPFDVGMLKKYFLSIAAPLIPSVSAFLIDSFQGLLSRLFA